MDKDGERERLTGDEEEKKKKRRCFCIPAACCWIMKVLLVLVVVALIGVAGVLMAIFLHVPGAGDLCAQTIRNCSATEDVTTRANVTCRPTDNGGNFHLSTKSGTYFDDCAGMCCREPGCKMFQIDSGECKLLSSCPLKVEKNFSMLYIPRREHINTVYKDCSTLDDISTTNVMTASVVGARKVTHVVTKEIHVVRGTRAPLIKYGKDLLTYKMDLVILLDGTRFTTMNMFQAVRDFITDTASKLNLDPDFTRIFVIYVGEKAKVVKSFQEVRQQGTKTKKVVLEKRDYLDFVDELRGLQFSDSQKLKPPITLLKTLYDTMKKREYLRQGLPNVYTVWFSKYPEELMSTTTDLLMKLRELEERRFVWLVERWNKFGMDILEELFEEKGFSDEATLDEAPDAAVMEFQRLFWAYVKKTLVTVRLTTVSARTCSSKIMEFNAELNRCVVKCYGEAVRDPKNPRRCVRKVVSTFCPENTVKLEGKCWSPCPKGTVRDVTDPAKCKGTTESKSPVECPSGTRMQGGECEKVARLKSGDEKDLFIRSQVDRKP